MSLFEVSTGGSSNHESITIYVDCNNSSTKQTGKTWHTAYSSLQTALTEASLECTKVYICIAKGTYFPTKIYSPNNQIGGASKSIDLRLRTFNIPNRTTLIGGFNGTETTRKECNAEENITVLSGLNKYWHVVTVGNDVNPNIKASCSLHNLTIQGGNAQGPSSGSIITQPVSYQHTCGGGVYITHGSTVKLHNIIIKNNNAGLTDPLDANKTTGGHGGGIFCSNSNLLMDKCTITDNSSEFRGAGVQIFNTFEDNIVVHHNVSCDPNRHHNSHCDPNGYHKSVIRNCVFSNNTTVVYGGGLNVIGVAKNPQSNVRVESCEFKDNSAQIGGAFQSINHDVTAECCTFDNNFSSVAAGALSVANAFTINGGYIKGAVNVNDSTFSNNVTAGNKELSDEIDMSLPGGVIRSHQGGGAISVYRDGILSVHNSTFANNVAQRGDGGALLNGKSKQLIGPNVENSVTTITDSKFLNNFALFGNGGAMANIGTNAKLIIRDTKFKGNKAPNGTGDKVYYSTD